MLRYAILDLPDAFNQMGIDLYGRYWGKQFSKIFPGISFSSYLSQVFWALGNQVASREARKLSREQRPEVFLQRWKQIWNKLNCEVFSFLDVLASSSS